jgi:hypothetical protein
MVLLWRGQVPVKTPTFSEIEACYFAEEDVATAPATLEEHEAKLRALMEPPPPPPKAVAEPPPAHVNPKLAEMKKQVRKVLVDAKVDPQVIAELDETNDPRAMFDLLQNAAQKAIRDLEAMAETLKGA